LLQTDDNIRQALEFKEQGNAAFKAGDYKKAVSNYHKMGMYVKTLDTAGQDPSGMGIGKGKEISDEDKAKVRELKLSHHLNLAMCLMKLENWDKAITNCSKALEVDEHSVKALFRRGKCRSLKGDLDGAKLDLLKANSLEPKDAAVKQELALLTQRFAAHEKKAKKQFAGMFDKIRAPEDAAEPAEPAEPVAKAAKPDTDEGGAAAKPDSEPEAVAA